MTRSFRLCLYVLWASIVFLISSGSAFAGCQAALTLSQLGTSGVQGTAIGTGNCFAAGMNGGPVGIFLKHNNGPFTGEKNCTDGTCQFDFAEHISCGNHQDWQLKVQCSKTSPDGLGCVPEADGTDQKTLNLDHGNSLSAGKTSKFLTGGGTYGVAGIFHVHAPDAWLARVIHYTWLLPDGTSPSAGSAQGVGSPTLDDVDVSFGGYIPPAKGGTLIATLDSCGDAFASVAVDAGGDHRCDDCEKHLPPGCQNCVGKPVHLQDGNMQITQIDPLPAFAGVAMKRTYDSDGPSLTWFGAGWSSIFDRTLIVYPNVLHGPWAVLWFNGTKRFVFRAVNGNWVQMWPLGQHRATLLTDPSTGAYTLQEPGRDIEVVIEPQDGLPVLYRSRSTGRALSITYNGTTPVHVSDSWGTFGWTINSSNHRVDAISIDGTSLAWQYVYSGGFLTAVNGPGGAAWRTYTYSGNRLTEARDSAGKLLESHTYDGFGRATTSFQAQDDIQSITYGAGTRNDGAEVMTRVQSASGAITNYWIAYFGGRARTVEIEGNCASCGVNNAVFAYKPGDYSQSGGELLRMQDARGYITEWTYDSANRVTAVTKGYKPANCDPETDAARCHQSPDSLRTLALASTSATETTGYFYGDGNWLDRPTVIGRSSVSNPGQPMTELLTYDATTGVVLTDTTHGWNGTVFETHVTTTVLYDGSEGSAFAPGGPFASGWQTLPQPAGLRKSVDGPRTDVADVTQWVYYPVNVAVPAFWRGRLAAVRNAANHITRFESYDALGNATRVVDANGVATEYTYDAVGRVLTTTLKAVAGCDTSADPLCATDLVTSRTYQSTFGPLASETGPNEGTTTYEYDALGRLSAMTRPVSASLSERLEYSYDPATAKKSAERYFSGQPDSWSLARSETFRYDSFGRLMAVDHPDSTSMLYTYDAANNVATVQDENHTTPNTAYKYDPLNRLTIVTQTLSTAPGGSITTQYAYDLHGNLTSVTDPNGNTTTYAFDDFGRMKQQVSPVTGTTTYTYDLAGNLRTTTDANTATTTRTYDALGRVTNATSSRTGLLDEEIAYTYDENCGAGNHIGRLSTMSDPIGVSTYCYDRRGLLTATTDGLGYSLMFAYDEEGNRASMTYPSGQAVTYTFDRSNRPLSATADGTPIVTTASYLPFGPAKAIVFGNGTTKNTTFDTRYRPLENKLTAPSGILAEYDYVTDSAGNTTQIHDAVDTTYNRDFGYDDLNRLTTANSGTSLWGTGGYQYDSMGNMKTLHIGSQYLTFSYDGTTPLLQNVTGTAMTPVDYDNAGNEEFGSYSPRNLLRRVGEIFGAQGFAVDYDYDGRGVRVVTRNVNPAPPPWGGTTSRTSIYSPELQLLAQSDWTGPLVELAEPPTFTGTEYIWFNGQPVAQTFTDPELATRYTFTDHLGTPILQTGPDRAVVWRVEYEPYGSIYAYRTGDADDPQVLRLPGQEASELSAQGISYNIFRWYRGEWGRYTQSDPVFRYRRISWREPNHYLYAIAAPTRYYDSRGLFSMGDSCKGCPPNDEWPIVRQRYEQEGRWLCEAVHSFIEDRALADCIESRCQDAVIECDNKCPDEVTDGLGRKIKPAAYTTRGTLERPASDVTICINRRAAETAKGNAGGKLIHEFAHNCGWREGEGKGVPF